MVESDCFCLKMLQNVAIKSQNKFQETLNGGKCPLLSKPLLVNG